MQEKKVSRVVKQISAVINSCMRSHGLRWPEDRQFLNRSGQQHHRIFLATIYHQLWWPYFQDTLTLIFWPIKSPSHLVQSLASSVSSVDYKGTPVVHSPQLSTKAAQRFPSGQLSSHSAMSIFLSMSLFQALLGVL